MRNVKLSMPVKFKPLLKPARYKVFYGGRGGGKSRNIAQVLILRAVREKLRILCAREFQRSIKDSVHKLLCDCIKNAGLEKLFKITSVSIICLKTGSEFIFCGMRHNASELKSIEGVDICWVEEAHSVSALSWEILKPTIRKDNSEIWISFNPCDAYAPVYKDFVLNPPPGALVVKVNYYDNPFFPSPLFKEMLHCRKTSPEDYAHIWLGEPRRATDSQIFKDKFEIADFDIPTESLRWFIGVDWGFSKDPVAITASFVKDNILHVAYEAGGTGIGLEQISVLLDSIPGRICRQWPIKADNSRPETISYVKNRGFNIRGASKWGGSVQDGIAHLKNFERIIIHERCKNTCAEFHLYSYKTDRITGDVLPLPEDKFNHYIDSLRYALDGYIKRKTIKISPEIAEAFK